MERAMLVEQNIQVMNIEVVGEAYDIAAPFLKATGVIANSSRINEPLLETIYKLFHAGTRNRLLLANKAITLLERAASH
jgi:hypothetical protein